MGAGWLNEMRGTIKRALDGGFRNDDLLLEIRSLKLTHNRTFADCTAVRQVCVRGLV